VYRVGGARRQSDCSRGWADEWSSVTSRRSRGNGNNTTDLNNKANPRDTCPAAVWAKVDSEALKKRYDVLGVFKDGPRHWSTDWIELPVGTMRTFDGLEGAVDGRSAAPVGVKLHEKGSSAYKPTTVARKSQIGFAKGQPVFILQSIRAVSFATIPRTECTCPSPTFRLDRFFICSLLCGYGK